MVELEPACQTADVTGPLPALKESRVLKMVTREKGKATAQATMKFLGAYRRLWAGLQGGQRSPSSGSRPLGSVVEMGGSS